MVVAHIQNLFIEIQNEPIIFGGIQPIDETEENELLMNGEDNQKSADNNKNNNAKM